MVKKFSATLDEWARKAQNRETAILRQSIQDVIDDAQTPVAKGGRMHVDTGFLRASGVASNTGMPSGPVRGGSDVPGYYSPDSLAVETVIAKTDVGTPFFFGWTANYARFRDHFDAFLRLAAMKWPVFVRKNTQKAKDRFK